jgi:hypothetical protein
VATYIVRLNDGERAYYMEWSTIVDAPVTYGMTREDFETYYRDEYGRSGAKDMPERMARVDAKGTSAHHDSSAWDTIWLNRAGKEETRLTLEQIVQHYCRDGGEGDPPLGAKASEGE